MRSEFDIARCRCPRCVTIRRLRLLSMICLFIISVCVGYAVFEFLNPTHFELPNLAPISKRLPRGQSAGVRGPALPAALPGTSMVTGRAAPTGDASIYCPTDRRRPRWQTTLSVTKHVASTSWNSFRHLDGKGSIV